MPFTTPASFMPTTPITSLQNQRIKNAVKLRDRRGRDKQRRIIIDGAREIRRAQQAGIALEELFWCDTICTEQVRRAIVDQCETGEVFPVTAEVFDKLAFGDRSDGVVAVAAQPDRKLSSFDVPTDGLIVVLEGIEKPGNVGAVLRSADASGVAGVIIADGGTDLFNPNCIRASLGTVFTIPIAVAKSEASLSWLNQRGTKILAARIDGAMWHTDANYRGATAIVLGSEATGLSERWSDEPVTAIKLPMLGVADSLNVSATAAVLCYEALRQREATSPTDR
jgi:TrmH family RNA methyltransferase